MKEGQEYLCPFMVTWIESPISVSQGPCRLDNGKSLSQ